MDRLSDRYPQIEAAVEGACVEKGTQLGDTGRKLLRAVLVTADEFVEEMRALEENPLSTEDAMAEYRRLLLELQRDRALGWWERDVTAYPLTEETLREAFGDLEDE